MMKENWIDDMKRKLDGHKMEPPTGLWEDISKQMGLSPESVRKPATMKRWYWAAAAGILALLGFFAVYQYNHPDSHEPLLQKETAVASQPFGQPISSEPSSEPSLPTEQEPAPAAPLLALVHKTTEQTAVEVTSEPSEIVPESSVVASEPSAVVSDAERSPSEVRQTPNKSPQQETRNMLGSSKNSPLPTPRSSQKRWSVGLNASGGLLAAANDVRTGLLYQEYYVQNLADIAGIGPQGIQGGSTEKPPSYYTRTEFVAKHHLPVRFGLSVQYQLNNHLALLGGINYTRLSSEFSIPLYPNIHYDQKLQYLGIPVGLVWQLWSTNDFRFYLSGGAMLEKCVRVDLEGGYRDKKPWQWSVDAAAGAEYTFIPQLGVYLEPSLGYYFDDGTSLEHYYKEHPLAPSIEFGLRLHLNK